MKSTDRQAADSDFLAFELKEFVSEDVREKLHTALNEVIKKYCEPANAVADKYGSCTAPVSDKRFTQNIFGSCQEPAPYAVTEMERQNKKGGF